MRGADTRVKREAVMHSWIEGQLFAAHFATTWWDQFEKTVYSLVFMHIVIRWSNGGYTSFVTQWTPTQIVKKRFPTTNIASLRFKKSRLVLYRPYNVHPPGRISARQSSKRVSTRHSNRNASGINWLFDEVSSWSIRMGAPPCSTDVSTAWFWQTGCSALLVGCSEQGIQSNTC